MRFEEIRSCLYHDGTLRDVYVVQASAGELDRFLDYVRPLIGPDSYKVGGEPQALPSSYAEAFAGGSEIGRTLSIPVGGAVVNCHFFDDSELELDFVPDEYCDESAWREMDSFLQGLADAMGRRVLVTDENSPASVLFYYEPGVGGNSG